MAFWPSDERLEGKKQSISEKRRDYPYLEPGLIGAATLSPDLDWTFLSDPGRDVVERRLGCRQQLEIYPPMRAPPKSEKASIKRRAEQGANFLRVYLPDVEVPSELIREQLSEDINLTRQFERFDSYSGNVLEIFENASNPQFLSILFPTGETNCDLSSCLVDISDQNVTFSPRADSLWSFLTPIQHLALSRRSIGCNLAVRTFGNLQLFTLKYADDSAESPIVDAHSAFSRADFAGERVVDMKFSSSSPNFLVLSDKGSLFESNLSCGFPVFDQLYQARSPENSSDFWRLSLDRNVRNRFILSARDILQFDTRTKSTDNILRLTAGKQVFTAIEDVQQENLLQFCSTNDILWLDLRFPRKPLLAYAHGREYDKYLTTTTVNFPGQGPLTFLSCRNNGLITVYDVSRCSDGLIHLNQSPYELSTNLYNKHIAQRFLEDGNSLGLLQLSEQGGVIYYEIMLHDGQTERQAVVRKSKEIREMEVAASNLRVHKAMLGAKSYTQVDMHEKYNALFNEDLLMKRPEKYSAESLDQMLQFFPYYMQNHELPVEHVLTAYDIAFRAGDEPQYPGRADFLTESILNSRMAYEALKEGRLAPAQVKAPWHKSIASTLQRLDEDFRSDPEELMEHLQGFNLSGDNVTEHVRKLEQDACQQLVLDLALSSDIFSETKFSKAREVGHSLETMTEALSLGDELPPIEFGYLRPLAPRQESHEIDDAASMQQPEIPPGVRLLLKEWDNSSRYVSGDPLKGLEPSTSKVMPIRDLRSVVAQIQRPPLILRSNVVASKAQSQDVISSTRSPKRQVAATQDFAISTQVLPGLFGGRPTTKKKPTKKRLGGF